MIPKPFLSRLLEFQSARQSLLCVGLDPDPERLPRHLVESHGLEEAIFRFCRDIVDATEEHACAFKINVAFFEAIGAEGVRVLERLMDDIRGRGVIILDAKRGDIGNTARMYARAIFEHLGADATTVAPYMGSDSISPFLGMSDRAAFVLARTSNPGSVDLQHLNSDGEPIYRHVARQVNRLDREHPGQAGLVVGATAPEALAELRELCPRLPFLVPGVGAQGGDPEAVVRAAHTEEGPVIVNSSRSIIYASDGRDFASAAAQAARDLSKRLRPIRVN